MNRFLMLFGGIWLLVGLPFLIAGFYLLGEERRFAEEAQVATGLVLTKDLARRRSNEGRSSTTYSVRYRFTTPDGQTHEGATDLSYARWNALAEREPIDIAYLPSNPSDNRMAGTDQRMLVTVFTVVGGCLTIAGSVIAGFGVRGRRRTKRLREKGVTADGVIVSVEPANVRINARPQARVQYEFRDHHGQQQHARSGYLPIDDAMRWKAGDRIVVRYDPDRPQQSLWEPDGGERQAFR